jgi:hypothetical protein
MLGVLKAPPADPTPEPTPTVQIEQYAVLKDAEVIGNRAKILLRKGKIVSSRTHDLEGLRAQGVQLGPMVV